MGSIMNLMLKIVALAVLMVITISVHSEANHNPPLMDDNLLETSLMAVTRMTNHSSCGKAEDRGPLTKHHVQEMIEGLGYGCSGLTVNLN